MKRYHFFCDNKNGQLIFFFTTSFSALSDFGLHKKLGQFLNIIFVLLRGSS